MTDNDIIELYFARDESAITETKNSYGRLMRNIALGILKNPQDAEECENEACLKAWNSIPPSKPHRLCAYLCKIARCTALDRYDYNNAAKRGTTLPIDELAECIASAGCVEDTLSESMLTQLLNDFLSGCDYNTRVIFLRRFWFGESTAEIAKRLHATRSMVKSRLSRTLQKLKDYLIKEGYTL